MAVQKINIEEFLKLTEHSLLLDVRSPGEFIHAQIPGACSLPLFTDEERKVVGTAYKQQSRKAAIKIGLDFFGVKMKGMVEEVEKLVDNWRVKTDSKKTFAGDKPQPATDNSVLVHCWRGGMRSAAIAWLLDMYGFKVYTLSGGYKAFRNWVLKQFQKEYNLKILGGYTGSGKTIILQELQQKNIRVIDLEKLANHKGSAFGAIGEKSQPSQEMFENILAVELFTKVQKNRDLEGAWIEDESQRIGKLIIPNSFWEIMRNSPVYFLDIPFEERLQYLVKTYGNFDKEDLAESIERIQKRLGGLETKNALNFLAENNITECFSILLCYYDKLYKKGLHNRKNCDTLLNIIPCPDVNSTSNLKKLLLQKV
jgi:tRNA 2-selenouridine synthase